jgi:hypothetical protein
MTLLIELHAILRHTPKQVVPDMRFFMHGVKGYEAGWRAHGHTYGWTDDEDIGFMMNEE